MSIFRMFIGIFLLLLGSKVAVVGQANYLDYHARSIATEQLIVNHEFEVALANYGALFRDYDFVYLRDYKIAAQLALVEEDSVHALIYLELGIAHGWDIDKVKKNELLKQYSNLYTNLFCLKKIIQNLFTVIFLS